MEIYIISTIHKKVYRSEVGNYRPVSLTSVICKLRESIIMDHIMSYLLRSDLLSTQQYGCTRQIHHAATASMLDDWTEDLESGGQIDVMYTDDEKAFDKVPHRRLLNKIFLFGLPYR